METAIKIFCKKIGKKSTKIGVFFCFYVKCILDTLLVAQSHLYMGINDHICRCGKRKNEFDMYFVTIMCLKSGWGNQI